MLYFAYGSMMNFGEMRQRCPSAQFVAVARLPDHALQFTRRSINRGCGVADAVPQKGKDVWGVVYDIPEIEFGRLDVAEGFRPGSPLTANAYVREHHHVYRDGDEVQPILVWVYLANPEPTNSPPNAAYKKLLVDGAKHWHLPGDYQAEIERVDIEQPLAPPRAATSYAEICDRVWRLYDIPAHRTVHSQPRNLLFPPPPRGRRVDLLFVGISPNHLAEIRFGRDRQEVERFAREFEYVSEAGNSDDRLHYDNYYGKLLEFARRVDDRFGVWKQVERGEKALLVEFTDCLHLATIPHNTADIGQFLDDRTDASSVWGECRGILEAELRLYEPRVVIGNGRPPSDMLWEICADDAGNDSGPQAMLVSTRFGCNVHRSVFITDMDEGRLARLAQDVQAHAAFRT